jgi:solute carrier family 25 S-adenosylmethionine transporter 26
VTSCPDFFPTQASSGQGMPSLSERVRGIYAQEGMKAFFGGVVPRTMWISAGGAVFLGVYEWTVNSVTTLT